ncbi:hypothetical protein BUE80_DR007877 [Diplocarpon rosae]|nr:hypothetical protein BUE80_DR007877 [Diplocarpon rosae]
MSTQRFTSFRAIYPYLISTYPAPLLPPSKPHLANLASQIAALQVHPTLEAALHILNADLPSAHFLVRHMQSAPAVEGMLLHGILHRVEGDFDNARFWYADVAKEGAELYTRIWGDGGVTFKDLDEGVREADFGARRDYGRGGAREGELDAGQRFVNAVQAFKETKAAARGVDEGEGLERESRREIETVVEWCVEKFGTGMWADASDAWVRNSEEVQKMSDEMVGGDKGRRKF